MYEAPLKQAEIRVNNDTQTAIIRYDDDPRWRRLAVRDALQAIETGRIVRTRDIEIFEVKEVHAKP